MEQNSFGDLSPTTNLLFIKKLRVICNNTSQTSEPVRRALAYKSMSLRPPERPRRVEVRRAEPQVQSIGYQPCQIFNHKTATSYTTLRRNEIRKKSYRFTWPLTRGWQSLIGTPRSRIILRPCLHQLEINKIGLNGSCTEGLTKKLNCIQK